MRTILIGFGIVGAFCIWKFIIQPKMNEGKPIEPPEDYKTFGEKLEEQVQQSVNTDVDF